MSVSRWVIRSQWLSGSLRSFFVQFFYVFLPPLLNIFCFCQVHTISVLYCACLCMKCSLGVSNFLEDIQSFPFYCFPLLLCIVHLGRLSYLSFLFFGTQYSDGFIFPFLLCLLLLFYSQLFVRPPQTAIFPFLHFFFLWMVLITASCTNLHLWFFRQSIRSNPLNIFITSTV